MYTPNFWIEKSGKIVFYTQIITVNKLNNLNSYLLYLDVDEQCLQCQR